MSLRPPSLRRDPALDNPLDAALRHEAAGEMAAALGRATHRLETALSRLAHAHDRLGPLKPADNERFLAAAKRWQRRHAEASEALWAMIIQRELCGLTRHETLLRALDVPASVRLYMGPVATAAAPPLPPSFSSPDGDAPSTGRNTA